MRSGRSLYDEYRSFTSSVNISSCVGASRKSLPRRSLQAEQVVAVLGPAVRSTSYGSRGSSAGKWTSWNPARVHLLADDALDVAVDDPAERQPGEAAGRGAADVAGPHQQPVARHLGVGRVLAQGPQEQRRHPQHPGRIPRRRPTRCDRIYSDGRCLVRAEPRGVGVRPTPCFVKGRGTMRCEARGGRPR